MLVEVKILASVITNQYGALSAGDILRTSPQFARHLVEDCKAAEYTAAATAAPATKTPAPRKSKEKQQ